MFDRDKWQEIYIALKTNKLRTFLTAFGVSWGIFMLIIMLGSGNGLENAVFDGFGEFATNSAFVWAQSTTMPYKGLPRGRRWNMTNEDMDALERNIPEIEYLAPRIQPGGGDGTNNVVRGLKTAAYTIFGDFPEYANVDPMNILKGRFINYVDILQKRKVAVIGPRVEEELFDKGENPIGQYIRIQGVYFQVVGVFEPKNKNVNFGGDIEKTIYLPFTSLQVAYNMGNQVHFFAVTAKKGTPVSIVEDRCLKILAERNRINPEDKQAIGHFNVEDEVRKVNGLFTGIDILIWIVGVMTLLAGVIGVSNIMLVVVKERTKEIGIQRALGATPGKIINQIITESVFLTSFAGYVGLTIGVAILELVNYGISSAGDSGDIMFKNPTVNFNVAATALVILVVSGALAGFIPAKRAVSIKPIDALRAE